MVKPDVIFPSDILPIGRIPIGAPGQVENPCSPHSLIYGNTQVDGRCPPVLKVGSTYRAFVFDTKTCQCYPVYSRGPCAADQWIVAKDGVYQCDLNPCFGFHTGVTLELVPFHGTCAEINKPHATCGKFEQVRLAEDGFTPRCTLVSPMEEKNLLRTIAGVGRHKTLKCPDGHKLSGDNECYPVVTFQDLQLDLQAPSEVLFW
ncbi:unnamed protein product [Allacma fusca]|uniref:DUF4789 domain-containing protein n=1 Tax=Allacma fusca TaxID=39272 RepID=A0A8J2KX62_9HEXA|nr:unnamed protein product [Allacma fusca]